MKALSKDPRLRRLGRTNVYVVREDGCELGAAGSIVIPRRNAKRPNVYATLYDALRSRIEIMLRYGVRRQGAGTELGSLAEMRLRIAETHAMLASGGGDPADAFAELAASLKGKSNLFKAEARAKVREGAVRAYGGTLNPGATRARLTAVDRRLEHRMDEVRSIAPWIGAMEIALLLELHRSVDAIRSVDACARAARKHPLACGECVTRGEREGVAARLSYAQRELLALDASPFLAYRSELSQLVLDAIIDARSGEAANFGPRLDRMLGVTTRALLRKRVEDIVTLCTVALLSCRGKAKDQVRESIQALQARLRSFLESPAAQHVRLENADLVTERLRESHDAVASGDLPRAKDILKIASLAL